MASVAVPVYWKLMGPTLVKGNIISCYNRQALQSVAEGFFLMHTKSYVGLLVFYYFHNKLPQN